VIAAIAQLSFGEEELRRCPKCENMRVMNTQFLTDDEGEKLAVVLPIQEYQDLMEDISDLAAVAERRNEERITLEQVKERLIADGLLPG